MGLITQYEVKAKTKLKIIKIKKSASRTYVCSQHLPCSFMARFGTSSRRSDHNNA